MALSDHDDNKNRPSKRARPAGDKGKYRHYSDSQKIEAVTTFLTLGEVKLTANLLKIPEVTLHSWKKSDWWKEIEQDLRQQEDLQMSNRLQRIYKKSLDQVEDRLERGDYIYDQKTGQLVRKPVSMKDAHKVAVDLIDKREGLLNKQTVQLSTEGVEDKLNKLAEKFMQLSKAKPAIQVTDVIIGEDKTIEETPDAIHEEREEGLQEGRPVGQEP